MKSTNPMKMKCEIPKPSMKLGEVLEMVANDHRRSHKIDEGSYFSTKQHYFKENPWKYTRRMSIFQSQESDLRIALSKNMIEYKIHQKFIKEKKIEDKEINGIRKMWTIKGIILPNCFDVILNQGLMRQNEGGREWKLNEKRSVK